MILHVLDARGQLSIQRGWIECSVMAVDAAVHAVAPLGPTDVVIQASPYVVPEKGHVGHAPEPGLIFITVDPANPALAENADMSLERMVAHEMHHALRWDGPGYGETLGEALVSEGLACHFVQELYGGPPKPWEMALTMDQLRKRSDEVLRNWDRADYDHADWFFGSATRPRWLGYSFGSALVSRFLAENPGAKPSTLATALAAGFRSSADLKGHRIATGGSA